MPARQSLLALLVALACHPSPPSSSPPTANFTAAEIIEWLLGERVRGPKTSNRGNSVGIVSYDLSGAEPTTTVVPNSCAPDLLQIISARERAGTRFALDQSGGLFRLTDSGWWPVSSPTPLPLLDGLLGFRNNPSSLELLVHTPGEQHELTLLTFDGDDVAIVVVEPVDLATFHNRGETLQRFDSGRCLDGIRDCLHLVVADNSLVLMREPVLMSEYHEDTGLPLGDGVRDVRYADQAGTKLDVLTTDACRTNGAELPSEPEQPEPSREPEATP